MLKRMDFKLENVTAIVASCVVLHNLCEKFGDTFCEEWATVTDSSDPNQHSASSTGCFTRSTPLAAEIRDAIKDYLTL